MPGYSGGLAPQRKVVAGVSTAVLAGIAVKLARHYLGVDLTEDESMGVVTAAFFVAAYVKRNAPKVEGRLRRYVARHRKPRRQP